MSESLPPFEPLPPLPWTTPGLRRLEWRRFLIACSMIVTMIAEIALTLLVGWYNLFAWLAVIAVQGFALHQMTQVIARERKLAFDQWSAEMDRRLRGD